MPDRPGTSARAVALQAAIVLLPVSTILAALVVAWQWLDSLLPVGPKPGANVIESASEGCGSVLATLILVGLFASFAQTALLLLILLFLQGGASTVVLVVLRLHERRPLRVRDLAIAHLIAAAGLIGMASIGGVVGTVKSAFAPADVRVDGVTVYGEPTSGVVVTEVEARIDGELRVYTAGPGWSAEGFATGPGHLRVAGLGRTDDFPREGISAFVDWGRKLEVAVPDGDLVRKDVPAPLAPSALSVTRPRSADEVRAWLARLPLGVCADLVARGQTEHVALRMKLNHYFTRVTTAPAAPTDAARCVRVVLEGLVASEIDAFEDDQVEVSFDLVGPR